MRFSAVLLALSLAMNVAFAAVLVRRARDSARMAKPMPQANAVHAASSAPAAAKPATVAANNTWAQLAADDLPTLIARLRAAGVAPRFVRAIVSALVAERFADQRAAIVAAMAAKPWWQGNPWDVYSDEKIAAMNRQLGHDIREMMLQLLGPEEPLDDYDRRWREQRYGGLSAEKLEQFRTLNRDYDDLMAEVRAQARGILLPEDRERLAFLEAEKRKDVAKLLTAEEQFEFDLRSGPTSKRLRDQLAAFEPSEDEFRAIFKIQQAVDAQFGDGRVQNLTAEQRRQRRDLSNGTGEQIRAVLSPERFAEYELKTDPSYLRTHEFVTEQALPASATATLVALQKDATARMQAINSDPSLTPAVRAARMAALAQEANATATATLGTAGVTAYKQFTGAWLANLERRAQPVAPRP